MLQGKKEKKKREKKKEKEVIHLSGPDQDSQPPSFFEELESSVRYPPPSALNPVLLPCQGMLPAPIFL